MSHFYVIALLNKDDIPNTEDVIRTRLEKYNENNNVDEYDRECYCVGNGESKLVTKKAENEFGDTWSNLRKKHDLWKDTLDKPDKENWEEWFNVTDKKWKEISKPLLKLEQKYRKEISGTVKPDKNCEECKGTGTFKSTYNPDSKWDWYRIGGRWDGEIQGEARPSEDGGFNFGEEHSQLDYNFAKVEDLIKRKEIPYAIVGPNGEWFEKGEMGWFGFSSNDKDDWNDQVLGIYEKYKDHVGVALDCHI